MDMVELVLLGVCTVYTSAQRPEGWFHSRLFCIPSTIAAIILQRDLEVTKLFKTNSTVGNGYNERRKHVFGMSAVVWP